MNNTTSIPYSTSTYSYSDESSLSQLFEHTSAEMGSLLFEQITQGK